MSFNQVENGILAYAIEQVKKQYQLFYRDICDNFYIGNSSIRFMIIQDGQDAGKLTVARNVKGEWVPDHNITPVDCYNLVEKDECIANAVKRLMAQGFFDNKSGMALESRL